MNGVKEDGELGGNCPSSVSNYGVGIGEAQGFKSGGGDGGHGFEASLSAVIIDKDFDENDLEIFETEAIA